jgi:iron complex transport system substrate-binding protein
MLEDEQISLWNRAEIRVLDVRYKVMQAGEALQDYKLPASAFLMVSEGQARLDVDDVAHNGRRFHVLHSGKGALLNIRTEEQSFAYYLIFYSAVMPVSGSRSMLGRLRPNNPFMLSYMIMPRQPGTLLEMTVQMHEVWTGSANASYPIRHLQVKALFYGLIHHLLSGGEEKHADSVPSGLVEEVQAYIREHYRSPLTLETLVRHFHYSVTHLSVLFKSSTGHSPIDYLIQVRLKEAERLLLTTGLSLRDIAGRIGYGDVHYFNRIFKKNKGIPPAKFRMNAEAERNSSKYSPPFTVGSSIDGRGASWYIADNEFHYHRKSQRGEPPMFKSVNKSAVVMTLLLSLTLLLGACGSAGSGSESSPSAGASTNTAQAASPSPEANRVMKDALGHDVTLPANPQRVLASYLEDHLVALGVTPVAQWSVYEGKTVQFYLQKELAKVPTIPSELPFEVVSSMDPDLILIDNAEMVAGEKYAQYAKIAPTYTVGDAANNDWRQELLMVGEVLNKQEEAKKALEAYETKAKDARGKLQKAVGQQSAAVLWVTAKSVYVVNPALSSGDVVYKDLGFTVPETVKKAVGDSNKNWNSLSLEVLGELGADHLFIVNARGITKEELVKDPIWANIPAVKNNNVYDYDNQHSWLYTGTIANSQIIDDVLNSVLNK